MFEMPDAWPTWSAETEAVDPDDAGPLAMPSPTASPTSGRTNAAYVHDASTNASAPEPTVASATPKAAAPAAPILVASGVINAVITIIPAAADRVARPASSAFMPSVAGFWK